VSAVILGFLVLIAIDTALLMLPEARQPGQPFSPVTALFTATSAVCVTGLVVVDTGTYWSTFGQGVILALIQLGGFGIMTSSMFTLIILRQPISFRNRFELREMSGMPNRQTVSGLVVFIVLMTLVLEVIGTLAMAVRMGGLDFDSTALWRAGFTAVSAFKNAGFDNLGGGTSLLRYARDPLILGIVALLVVLGGLGPLVLIDAATPCSAAGGPARRRALRRRHRRPRWWGGHGRRHDDGKDEVREHAGAGARERQHDEDHAYQHRIDVEILAEASAHAEQHLVAVAAPQASWLRRHGYLPLPARKAGIRILTALPRRQAPDGCSGATANTMLNWRQ